MKKLDAKIMSLTYSTIMFLIIVTLTIICSTVIGAGSTNAESLSNNDRYRTAKQDNYLLSEKTDNNKDNVFDWYGNTLKELKETNTLEEYLPPETKEKLKEYDKILLADKLHQLYLKNQYEKRKEEEVRRRNMILSSRKSADRNSDLSNKSLYITEAEMNAIIDKWSNYTDTPFKNKGYIFIKASKESGLDPLYILAHAAWESNWGKSYLARTKSNYFGINAVDSDPSLAYHVGNNMEEGIVNGAIWIRHNYYDQGCTTLHLMIHGNKQYAQAKDKWVRGVGSIMRESYGFLQEVRNKE